MKHCSDALLRRMYLDFNRRFFAGELPIDTRVLWMPVADDRVAETERPAGGRFTIRISPSIASLRCYYRLILLHEMCHIKLWNRRHACRTMGAAWKNEVLRVLAAGAVRWF